MGAAAVGLGYGPATPRFRRAGWRRPAGWARAHAWPCPDPAWLGRSPRSLAGRDRQSTWVR